jgi:hypothetical protein
MTCTHINQAKTKINSLVGMLRNTSSRVYQKKGPYVDPGDIESHLDGGF